MSQTGNTQFHVNTGHAPIDALRYSNHVALEPHRHAATEILLFKVAAECHNNCVMTAQRDVWEPDMLMISRGSGRAAHGNMAGSKFTAPPSTSIRATFVPRGADSHVTYYNSSQTTGLLFPTGFLAKLVSEQKFTGFDPILFQEDASLITLVQMMEAEISAPGFGSQFFVEGVSRAIATILLRADRAAIRQQADRIYLTPHKLRRVIEFIDARLDKDLRLEDLAQVANLSIFHFARVFKRATGVSPYQYVRNRRLELACTLLREDSLDLAQLALACGFSNQSHFTSAFSRQLGVSPGRFRRDARP